MLYGYLFYSNDKQGYCKSFITLLERHGINKMFRYYLVDEMREEDITKFNLETVPTIMIVSDNGTQKMQQKFEGNNAFKWVENFLISRRQSVIKNAENARKLIQNSNAKERLIQKLYEYCPNEHEGVSDTYAYYNEDETKDINVAQGKTFVNGLLNQNDNIGAIPVGDSVNIKEYKKKEGLTAVYGNNIHNIVKNIENDRKKQDEIMKTNMEQNTINHIARNIMNSQE